MPHPLLQQQYELHRKRLEQCCERPVEQVLYHARRCPPGPDICAHGFNRSFLRPHGELGTLRRGGSAPWKLPRPHPNPVHYPAGALYGQGVYFAKRASLSVLDRYRPRCRGSQGVRHGC